MLTTQTLLTLLGSLGLPVIITGLLKLAETRRTLHAAEPKAAAEAVDLGVSAQQKVINTLEAENERLTAKINTADTVNDQREQRYQAQIATLTAKLDQVREELTASLEKVRHEWETERELQRMETHTFRRAVAALLLENDIPLPPWWNQPLMAPPFRPTPRQEP